MAVIPRGTVNSYTIETVKKDKKVTVELNYEILSNKTYVTDYKVEPLPVILPAKPVYFPEVLTIDDKINFIDVVKTCQSSEVQAPINVVCSSTISHPLYKETLLKVETLKNNFFVKVIV